ncbi:MAG: ferrochelatase [Chloroflexi bacterium]|nr:ferrochelatase [Chloroflexota bacterium]
MVCPGFAVACLKTIDEDGLEVRATYQNNGGGQVEFIPALNDSPIHILALVNVKLSTRMWVG